jgi:phosphate transporter
LPEDNQVIETIPSKNALERLDSTRRSRRGKRDSDATFLSSESESEYGTERSALSNQRNSISNKPNPHNETAPPNIIEEAEELPDETVVKKPVVGFSSASNLPTRSNTVGSNFRSRRGSAIERSLSQHDGMVAYAESKPSRIMRSGSFKFGRRRGSHISMQQADDVNEFNRYFNFRVRCAATYISLTELKAYADCNKTAFDKILKKWDKVTGSHLREAYFDKIVDTTHAFTPENFERIQAAIELILSIYAAVFTMGRKDNAEIELKMHMRDHIQFERTSVWKDLVGKERQTMDAHAEIPQKGYVVPFINVFVSKGTLFKLLGFTVSIILYIILMCVDTMGDYEASKCLALLVFAALMWASEVKTNNI